MSPQDLALLERWVPLAHDSIGMLDESPESVLGKPWDYSDYVRIFRLKEGTLFLEVDGSRCRTSGRLEGVLGVRSQAHPWGSALCLQGPLRWIGTRTHERTVGQPRTEKYDVVWPQLTLVLPCTWTP